MARNGFFTGLDIGTSSIKVLVAEYIAGEMNVIGVSNIKSSGVKDGIIVDIEAAAATIRTAIEQAEEKSGMTIERVNVGLPANLLQIEPTQGMVPIISDTKEIKDEDVESVIQSALTKSIVPDREVISIIPKEFVVDTFAGIRDPRGMMGTRLEMRALIYTGPSTIIHNLRRTVERAGIKAEHIIITPLSLTRSILNEGEREFGGIVIDLGGGQTTVAAMRAQELEYTNVYIEGGDYITKDISKVLKTSLQTAEALKFNFGEANVEQASDTETVQVEVVGAREPVEITERYLAEIISARLKHILDQVRQDLERGRLLDLPGGIILVGGGAILPGIVELAEQVLGTQVKLYVPNQVGIRNPIFANVIGMVEYVGTLTEVDEISQRAIYGDAMLRQQPIDIYRSAPTQPVKQPTQQSYSVADYERYQTPVSPVETGYQVPPAEPTTRSPQQEAEPVEPKTKFSDRVRGIFGSMFD